MRVLTAAQASGADAAAAAAGIPVALLMEQAGAAVAAAAEDRFVRETGAGVVVLAGAGANGGDGLVCARVLADRGRRVVVLAARGPDRGAQAEGLARLAPYGIEVRALCGEESVAAFGAWPGALAIDAVTGTGVHGVLRGDAAAALGAARRMAGALLAIDLPSGVDPDGGEVAGGAVRADRTVAMAFLKPGHLLWPGAGLCGDVEVAAIGLSPFAPADAMQTLSAAEAAALVPVRPPTSHKGDAGRLLIWAGSPGMEGAAVLATRSALRSGAGLVTTASTEEVRRALLVAAPEAMTRPADMAIEDGSGSWDAVAAGPGLGRTAQTAARVRRLLAQTCRLVLDADALTSLADTDAGMWEALRGARAAAGNALVLTPHPGEAATLLAVPEAGQPVWREARPAAGAVDAARIDAARALARAAGAVVLLKGRPTVIAGPDGSVRLNRTGGAMLAAGGSGDVLTGLVGGLLAQGLSGFDAATLGAYLHGLAAESAAEGLDRAVRPGDVAEALPEAYRRLAGEGGGAG